MSQTLAMWLVSPSSSLQSTALGQKRYVCPSPPRGAPKAKRTALGDLTNREPAGTVRDEGAGKKAVSAILWKVDRFLAHAGV